MKLKVDAINIFLITLLILSAYSLIHHYNTRSTPHQTLTIYSLLKPVTTTKYKVKDVYNKLFDLGFQFTVNPLTCDGLNHLLILVIVSSNPTNYDNRSAIRSTYGKSTECIKTLFLLGESLDNETAGKIANESSTFHDIIQGNFIDAYKNMTYKHVMGLKWSAHHCPAAKYVLKVDDDVIVNTVELPRFVSRELSPFGALKLMLCKPYWRSKVVRDNNSKWYASETQIPTQFYPPYCFGPFILYSKDVVISLLETSQTMPYFYIDDAFITGMVAEKVGVIPTDIANLFLNQNLVDLKKSTGQLPRFLMGPWELDAQRMVDMWKAVA